MPEGFSIGARRIHDWCPKDSRLVPEGLSIGSREISKWFANYSMKTTSESIATKTGQEQKSHLSGLSIARRIRTKPGFSYAAQASLSMLSKV